MTTATGLPGGVNPLDFLYKLATQRGLTRPEFQQMGEQGPPHMKTFVWHCSFNNIVAQGTGRSKKEAKVAAARAVREQLDFDGLPPAVTGGQADRKRKKAENDAAAGTAGAAKNGGGRNSKKARKLFEGGFYGGPVVPYGYAMMPFYGMDFPPADDAGPCIDPHGFDPFAGGGGQPAKKAVVGGVGPRVFRGFSSRVSKLDRYVIKKHTEVYPDEEKLDLVLKLVNDTEDAIKAAMGEWNDKKPGGGPEDKDKDTGKLPAIEGFVRVGDLAKGLLLATDNTVDLVVMCASAPTMDALEKVHGLVAAKLAAGYETRADFAGSGFCVSAKTDKGHHLECNVTMTSAALRRMKTADNKDDSQEEADKEEEEENDVENALPKDKCLEALAKLRQSRWFAAMAASIPSCVECIRIVKDLARRDPSWSPLTDWAIELIVERALFSAYRPLNPAASLMRVMEIFATGLILADADVLTDPCERMETGVVAYLNAQQREDITRSAQHYLRLMHFRQIYKVLGMDKDAVFDEPAKADDDDDDDNDNDKAGDNNGVDGKPTNGNNGSS